MSTIPLDNIEKSRVGGLQAHNYWYNEEQFVAQLADVMRALAEKDASKLRR